MVFLLNRYFAEMGHAVEEAGGRIDKFIGDGVMALFGLDSGVEARLPRGARRGQGHGRAPASISTARSPTTCPSRCASASASMSAPRSSARWAMARAVSVTAVGDSVNTASRLEGLTKTYGAQLVVSEAVVLRAGIALGRCAAARDRDPRPGRAARGAHVRQRPGSARAGA